MKAARAGASKVAVTPPYRAEEEIGSHCAKVTENRLSALPDYAASTLNYKRILGRVARDPQLPPSLRSAS